jgi:hypothetical protein
MSVAITGLTRISANPEARRFASMIFLVGLGVEVSRVAQTTFFLQNVGADQLPLVFICFATVMVMASSGYAWAARKVPLESLALTALAIAIGAVATFWVLIVTGTHSAVLAYALYCTVEMCFIFLPLTLWAVMNRFFSAEEAELSLPSIAACGLVGAFTGAMISRAVVGAIGPYNTLPLAVVAYGLCLYLGSAIGSPPRRATIVGGHRAPRPLMKEPLVATLTFLSLPMFFIAYVLEYMYYSTMGQVFTSATDLSQFISTFGVICAVAGVLSQLFLTPFLFRRLGIGTTAFVYPAALALGSLLALIYALYLGSRSPDAGAPSMFLVLFVLAARSLDIVLYQSVYDSTTNILYYAVPEQTRTRARSLIGGIMFPASVAFSGLLLMSFSYFNQPMHNVAFAAIAVGFLVLVMAMDVRPDYLRSLLANGDEGNSKARTALLAEIGRLSLNESRVLLLESLQTDREDEALFALQKLLDTYDHFLLEDLQEIKMRIQPRVMSALTSAMAARGIPEEDRLLLA